MFINNNEKKITKKKHEKTKYKKKISKSNQENYGNINGRKNHINLETLYPKMNKNLFFNDKNK